MTAETWYENMKVEIIQFFLQEDLKGKKRNQFFSLWEGCSIQSHPTTLGLVS